MKFSLILFTFCIFGCGGSGGSVDLPAGAFTNNTTAAPTVINNTNSGNTTNTTNTNSGNTTTTDNSTNNSYNNYTGGK